MYQLLIFLFLCFSSLSFAEYTLKDGKLVEKETVATQPVQEHYSEMIKAYEKKDWKMLEREAIIVVKFFSKTPYGRDAMYFLGVAYFEQNDYEMANLKFTDYLTHQATPKYFEQAIQYKFEIGEKFREGARKHIMGFKSMPKWAPAGAEAVEIYDEVISALPHHELAAQALFGKAQVQAKREDFRAAVESYQTLIRRFPKHPLAVESYIGIGKVYLVQCQSRYPDPDYLDLSELNLRKFRSSFPGEEKLAVGQKDFGLMQEHYAQSLFETARFYERTNKWGAAKIYYSKILKSYPRTEIAKECQPHFENVSKKLAKLEAKKARSKK